MLKKIDFFPKYSDPDVKIKTNMGAFMSVCTVSAMVVLFFHEFYRFVKPKIYDEIVVDTSRIGLQRTMPITFNMTIFNPCKAPIRKRNAMFHKNLLSSEAECQLVCFINIVKYAVSAQDIDNSLRKLCANLEILD